MLYCQEEQYRRKKHMEKIIIFLNKLLSKFNIFKREVYYVGGNDALPPPLSKEEEEDLINKLNNGDETIRSILIERNLRLVVYIARKFENTGVNVEDLISVGTIGLIKAVNTFNPEKKKLSLQLMHQDVQKMKF
eukprot:TRINITY_DN8145_c0_g1_i1.p6 TRINITY_DN8145_c0_g1~~TRINITY_DN8145_c0_g1_i1.p6  ORF type:complete len:134 (-),score=22.93 TRINITY_DN8145_c0_g1_i1:305-706(-)